jgi:hypothetical protein
MSEKTLNAGLSVPAPRVHLETPDDRGGPEEDAGAGQTLDPQDPALFGPVIPAGDNVVEMAGRHAKDSSHRDAGEVYESLRRDLEQLTGRGGRPWHMLTPQQRDEWLKVLQTMDPLHKY